MSSLLRRGLTGLAWNLGGNLARVALQFGVGVLLARLLGPGPFGAVAIVWLLMSFGNLLADAGFGAALVQKRELDSHDIDTAFTLQFLLGSVLTVSVFLLASAIAAYFKEPQATDLIRVSSMLFVIRAASQSNTALLNREMNFKVTQGLSIGSYVLGFAVVGAGGAILGWGAWSLIAAQLAQATSYTLVTAIFVRRMPRLSFHGDFLHMLRFGSPVAGANLLSWLIMNIDSIVIGRLFGPIWLGLYNRAFNLINTPVNTLSASMQPVLFSGVSRGRGAPDQVANAFLAATQGVAFLTFPMLACVAAISTPVILGVYGAQWVEAAVVLRPLAVGLMVHMVLAQIGPVLSGVGQPMREFRAQLLSAMVGVPLVLLGAQVSPVMVAWSVVAAYIVRFGFLLWQLQRAIGLSPLRVLATLWPPAACAFLAAGLLAGVEHVLPTTEATAIVRLIGLMACAGVFVAIALAIFYGSFAKGPLMTIVARSDKLPQPLRRLLRLEPIASTTGEHP